MASSDNFTNEKASYFDDGAYDPDLEARLYAEIYYSNETYVPDSESSFPNDKETPNGASNVETSFSSKTVATSGIVTGNNPVPLNRDNRLPTDNFVEDYRPDSDIGGRQHSDGKSYYPTKNWVFGEVRGIDNDGFDNQIVRPKVVKRQRLLAHKGLWFTPDNTQGTGSAVGRANATPIRTETCTAAPGSNTLTSVTRLIANEANDVIRNDSSEHDELVLTKRSSARIRQQKRKNLKQFFAKMTRKKTLGRENDALNNVGVTMETSKYKVVSKKKKLKMNEKNPEPVDISSDSDDSILEVPVPPKAPPVIIQLPDSDDDCEKSTNVRSEKTKKSIVERNDESISCCNLDTDSSTSSASLEPTPEKSTPLNSDVITDEPGNKARNSDEVFIEPTCPEGNNLILNCTEIQRGASSLDEIRKIRETGPSIHAHSDDSMTESEANNWVNIAAGQSESRIDEEICTIEISNDTVNTEMWDQLRQENPPAAGLPTEIPSTSGGLSFVDETVVNVETESNASIINEEVTGTRKRQKDVASRPFTDFDVPAIPEKRSKRNKDKSSREQSLTEYFFKPMSKELQAFYNNPWGGENMDLYDIQSRMPKNPKCWTILDADLQGSTSKRRRTCPRCKTDLHWGKRCPEKAKAPCCYMCGAKGHTESRCPHTMCLTCGRKYATYRPTCGFCSKLYCNMCSGFGHSNENCPDLWRRYHNTTTETIPIVPRDAFSIMKAPQHLTCCNCAKRGHDVTMCKQLRWSQHFPTPMFVSSYTEGPFYKSLHHEAIQDPSPSEDVIHESPHYERIEDSNPIADPIYAPPYHERIQDTNPENDIEILEDHRGRDVSIIEPSTSLSSNNVIFQAKYFEQSELMNWHRISKRLDNLNDVHLDGLFTGRLIPKFLRPWRKIFHFSVTISNDPDKVVHMVIEAKCPLLLKGLEKVMMQWLMRNDDEKPYMQYHILPYNKKIKMMDTLKKKMLLLSSVLQPTVLLKKIVALEEELRCMHAKVNAGTIVTKKNRKKWIFDERIKAIRSRRSQLVTSLYSQSWVDDGDAIVQSFRHLVHQIKSKAKKRPTPNGDSIRNYFELIYLYNELFTFHTSEALSKALDKAILVSQQSEVAATQIPQQPPVDTSSGILSGSHVEPIENIVVRGNNSSGNPPNLPAIDKNSLSAYCSPLPPQNAQQIIVIDDSGAESPSIPTIFGTTDTRNMISSSTNDLTAINFSKEGNASFKPVRVNGIVSQKAALAPPMNRRKIIKRADMQNVDRNQGLLRNLTKRNRKLYRTSAKQVIKLANSSNIPHLQEMAKVLKFKIGNGSITTDDVHMLQNAIGPKLGHKVTAKQQSQRPRRSLRNNYDKTYQDFLTTL